MGATAISNEAQLYFGDKNDLSDGAYPGDFLDDGALYYTSTYNSNKTVFWAVEKGLQNKRVEKDIYIAELNSIINILEQLGDKCAKNITLSYNETVYNIGRIRKNFARLWKMIQDRDSCFSKKQNEEREQFTSLIRNLSTLLTDSSEYNRVEDSYDQVTLGRGNIYLNNTIKPVIDKTLTAIKDIILRLKIDINHKL